MAGYRRAINRHASSVAMATAATASSRWPSRRAISASMSTFSAIWSFTPVGAYRTRLTQRLVLEGDTALGLEIKNALDALGWD